MAYIVDGKIIDRRDIETNGIPEHKRHLWRPIVVEGDGPIVTETIKDDCVVCEHSHPPLKQIKDQYLSNLDHDARRVTVEMTMVHKDKLEQAEQVMSHDASEIDALSADQAIQSFPTLAAGIGIDAPTLSQCAEVVMQEYQNWAMMTHKIERARLLGKRAIRKAKTVEEVFAAYKAVDWGQDG